MQLDEDIAKERIDAILKSANKSHYNTFENYEMVKRFYNDEESHNGKHKAEGFIDFLVASICLMRDEEKEESSLL